MNRHKILVVDDEQDLVNLLSYNLKKEGYEVISAYDGLSALELIRQHVPDLVILDLMLPDLSGYDVCNQLKTLEETQKIPVIMLTARSAERDRIKGFEMGAEDYVVKPFSPKELMLRVKAMLGRLGKEPSSALQVGHLKILPDEHRVLWTAQEPSAEITLTNIEFKILHSLARQPNAVKTREQLLTEVWQQDAEEITDRAVDTHVKRLRSKLGDARHMVETIRGVGYRMVAAPTTNGSSSTVA